MDKKLQGDALVRAAIEFALAAHEGQRDADGAPLAAHPVHAAMQMRLASPEQLAACVLHDTVEDTPATLTELEEAGFPPAVVDAVDALTRRNGEPYGEYIDRICANPDACRAKLADIQDNRRTGKGFSESLQARYDAAALAIRASLGDDGQRPLQVRPAPRTPYDWLLAARAGSAYAAARKVLEAREWELSSAVVYALCDEGVPGDVLNMLLLSCSTLDVEDMCALAYAFVDGGVCRRNLRIAQESDTPVGEMAVLFASQTGWTS